MRSLRVVALLLLAALAGFPAAEPGAASDRPPTLILLSFDGWRWDYHDKAPAPNLRRLIAGGVRAERLIPVFPTKTFPNHYTVVTGLYPERSGVVGNSMRDPASGLAFKMSDRGAVSDSRWWGGEPLWVTAERQGVASAVYFWPGSEALIGGVRPRFWKPYDESIPNAQRVREMLGWLDRPPSERPRLVIGYFSDVDTAGHRSGPLSKEVAAAIASVDRTLGSLLDGLAARGLTGSTNVAVVSDHGMAETAPPRVITLDNFLPRGAATIVESGAYVGIDPGDMTAEQIYKRLHGAHPRLRVFLREQTPAHWHFRSNPRIPTIVGVADEGWLAVSGLAAAAGSSFSKGNHGYDPQLASMHGLFVAAGPAFRRGATVPPLENVHLYNALCSALGLRPAPNDGDPALARGLLAP
jgi:predicted AlkP superfamily pyrophosphatase or phosphodiesterase